MKFLYAFLIGGALCVPAQILIDKTKITSARILTAYVVCGVIVGAFGIYDALIDAAGAGASVPLLGFGNVLAKGVKEAIDEKGAIGILTGGMSGASAGITTATVLSVVWAILFRSKTK